MSSARRRASRQDANQMEIVRALRDAGCSVYIIDQPVDLLVGRAGRNYLLEVKGSGGRLTPGQVTFFEEWRGDVHIVRSTAQALEAVGLL